MRQINVENERTKGRSKDNIIYQNTDLIEINLKDNFRSKI